MKSNLDDRGMSLAKTAQIPQGVRNVIIDTDDRPTRNPLWRNPADEVIVVARRVEAEAFEEFFLSRLIY